MVTKAKKEEVENKLTLKSLSIIVGIVLGVLSVFTGGFVYIDDRYVHQDIYDLQIEQSDKDFITLDDKTAQLFTASQSAHNQELNKIRQEIKSASALPLVVKRDLLLSYTNRTDREDAELALIQQKLVDLNIQQ